MNIRDRKALLDQADNALSQAQYEPKKLMLIYVGVCAIISLLQMLLSNMVYLQVDMTGGLRGIDSRVLWTTLETVFSYGVLILMPIWTVGIAYAGIRISRYETVGPNSLMMGFHRFGPVFRTMLLQYVILYFAVMVSVYLAFFVWILTPQTWTYMQQMVSGMATDGLEYLESMTNYVEIEGVEALLSSDAMIKAFQEALPLLENLLPLMLSLFGLLIFVMGLVLIPLSYAMRLMPYLTVDKERIGAFEALRRSFRMTKGQKWALFRLDLKFWWFYVLLALASGIYTVPVYLQLFGVIQLPFSLNTTTVLFYLLYLAVYIPLFVHVGPKLQVTYALAYGALRGDKPALPQETAQAPEEE